MSNINNYLIHHKQARIITLLLSSYLLYKSSGRNTFYTVRMGNYGRLSAKQYHLQDKEATVQLYKN